MGTLKALVNGVWVPIGSGGSGTGSDEVFVQPNDPITANPTAELWYDTDAVATIAAPPASGFEISKPAASALYAGLRYFATDTLRDWLCDGTGWIIMGEPVQTGFTPTVTPAAGTITTLGAVSFAYHRRDGWLDWNVSIAITTNGTGAGNVQFTLPAASLVISRGIGSGREDNLTGKMLNVVSNAPLAGAAIFYYDNTYPGANGCLINAGGSYRMTTRYT
jgi:hypothetical protein